MAHPAVPVVVDHLGRVDMADSDAEAQLDGLLALADISNISVKVSELDQVSGAADPMYPFADTWPYVARAYDAFGPDRLLWGTGYPGSARASFGRPELDEEIALIRDMLPGLTDDDRAKILGRNAATLWGFTQ